VLFGPAWGGFPKEIQAIGKDFDPEAFSIELADTSIAARFGRS
jgi:hypothetical protein